MHKFTSLTFAALLLAGCDQGAEDAAGSNIDAVAPTAVEEPAAGPEPEDTRPAATTRPDSLAPRIPVFNAVCGPGFEVHANEGGPVFIDGEQTTLEKFNDNYFEASLDGTTISISFNPDESLSLTYSGPNRANGICTLQ
tara:strand:+ start:191 stop:607 length:417 start_codon:yes stop_codon:yes gene_type:complete